MALEPVSRIELLAAGVEIEPISRLEKFVAAAAGTYTLPDDIKPISRLEYFLSEISGGGGGGGEGTLVKANTSLYLRNVGAVDASWTSSLRFAENPFDKEGFYLRAKIHHIPDGLYANDSYHYLLGIGGHINTFNNSNADTIFFIDNYSATPLERIGIAFQMATREVYTQVGSDFEILLTIDSMTINDEAVTLSNNSLATLNNIADLAPSDLLIGVTANSNRSIYSIIDELEIGVIS